MRAVWLSVAWVVACGGRSVGDPIFDEPPGGAKPDPVGGWSNSSSGGSASGGRTKTTGGRASTGGTPAVTGGRPSTGGSNTGGTTTVDRAAKSCASFCQSLVKVCGSAIDSNEAECASGCVTEIKSLSMPCQVARQDALACVQKSLSRPGTSCQDMPRILQSDCLSLLARSALCGN
ncbi:MAG TPA: hypothetical protein VG937_35565 [Polyangiaceae bacterium]|nr:hypothetical protein [Polyangiaceae bacterium]